MNREKGLQQKKQVVIFDLAGETYGADISEVREIVRVAEVTSVPKAPPSVSGVIDLRGRVVPVIDLNKRFGLPEGKLSKKSRIIVAEIAGELVGIKVDAATGVLKIDASNIEHAPDIAVTEEMKTAILGVAKLGESLVILLNLQKVLPEEELRQVKGLKGA